LNSATSRRTPAWPSPWPTSLLVPQNGTASFFSAISTNWRGRPLTSHEVVVDLIGATSTKTGLRVHAERDVTRYPKGVKVTDEDLASVDLKPHDFHGEWNYTIGGSRPPPPRKQAP